MNIPADNYIGEPGYPSPWTTTLPREGLRDNDAARIVSLAPDVCKSPKVPVPYPVVDFCGHDANYTPSVRFTTQKAMVLRSHTTHVHGDEPGVGKGVKSGTVGGICEPIGHASQIRAEGSPVIRHLDRFYMNNRNTFGEAIFVRDMGVYPAPKLTDPVPGSLLLAGTGSAAALSAPMPNPQPVPNPQPSPRPPGQVIRPDFPQWQRKPPPAPGIGRLGAFGRLLGRLSLPLALLWPEPLADGTLPGWNHETPQDDYEEWLKEEAERQYREAPSERPRIEEEYREQLKRHRAERAPAPSEEEDPAPAPVPNTDPSRITPRNREFKCLVGPYSEIRPICPGEAHHLVPDYTLRHGTRAEGIAGLNRNPNAPSFAGGMTICLLPAEHTGVHGPLNQGIASLGYHPSPVPGTAPMYEILDEVEKSINRIPIPEDCKARALAAARAQLMPILAQPGRTTITLPDPAATTVLRQGHY
jgi:Domain of unknown function (DUF4150)